MKRLDIIKRLQERRYVGKFNGAITTYAIEMLEDIDYIEELNKINCQKLMLNGAENAYKYSESGMSLIYDEDIAQRLATPSQIKKFKRYTNWIQMQGRAIELALYRVQLILEEEAM